MFLAWKTDHELIASWVARILGAILPKTHMSLVVSIFRRWLMCTLQKKDVHYDVQNYCHLDYARPHTIRKEAELAQEARKRIAFSYARELLACE